MLTRINYVAQVRFFRVIHRLCGYQPAQGPEYLLDAGFARFVYFLSII